MRLITVQAFIAVFMIVAQIGAPRSQLQQDLTWADRLPLGCRLISAPSIRLEGNKVLSGLWGNLPIPTNPWAGTDRHLVALIRERMYGLPRGPDGPPLSQRENAQYLLHLADGVEEGYTAFYEQAESQGVAVSVYALRFADTEPIPELPRRSRVPSDTRIVTWVQINSVVALMIGEPSDCSRAVEMNLKSLGK